MCRGRREEQETDQPMWESTNNTKTLCSWDWIITTFRRQVPEPRKGNNLLNRCMPISFNTKKGMLWLWTNKFSSNSSSISLSILLGRWATQKWGRSSRALRGNSSIQQWVRRGKMILLEAVGSMRSSFHCIILLQRFRRSLRPPLIRWWWGATYPQTTTVLAWIISWFSMPHLQTVKGQLESRQWS